MKEAMKIDKIPVTLANGQTKTPNIITSEKLVALIIPPNYNGSTITFEASDEPNGTYYPVFQPDRVGGAVSIAATPNSYVPFVVTEMFSFQYFRLVSNVAANANITFTLIYK